MMTSHNNLFLYPDPDENQNNEYFTLLRKMFYFVKTIFHFGMPTRRNLCNSARHWPPDRIKPLRVIIH